MTNKKYYINYIFSKLIFVGKVFQKKCSSYKIEKFISLIVLLIITQNIFFQQNILLKIQLILLMLPQNNAPISNIFVKLPKYGPLRSMPSRL